MAALDCASSRMSDPLVGEGALAGKPPERHRVRAVLRRDAFVVTHHRLVGPQRRQADDTRTNPGDLGDVPLERVLRPFAVVQKRDLETNAVPLVDAVTLFRCVAAIRSSRTR